MKQSTAQAFTIYLWGIETRYWWAVFNGAYGLLFTYEELKPTLRGVKDKTKAVYYLPMRNWNGIVRVLAGGTVSGLLFTYEELKQG